MKSGFFKGKKLSLMEAYPSLAKEWHPEKNDVLTPGDVTPGDFIPQKLPSLFEKIGQKLQPG